MALKDGMVFLRYPGGKQRQLLGFAHLLPGSDTFERYVEPFVGGGAVYFSMNPCRAVLSDINPDLIDLYCAIRDYPQDVWTIFKSLPSTKVGYYEIRSWKCAQLDLATRGARTLYLNRTCFKGMWRHNANGEFNVGYGGEERRWVINLENLEDVAVRLRSAIIACGDFETAIQDCTVGDFVFVDPPYRPGEREMLHHHYRFGKFSYIEQARLACLLHKASERGVRWAMTNSSHPDILALYKNVEISVLAKGTGRKPGHITNMSGEVFIRNYQETWR